MNYNTNEKKKNDEVYECCKAKEKWARVKTVNECLLHNIHYVIKTSDEDAVSIDPNTV